MKKIYKPLKIRVVEFKNLMDANIIIESKVSNEEAGAKQNNTMFDDEDEEYGDNNGSYNLW